MWLTVEHITRYGYDGAINEAYTELRVKPLHRDGQRCSSFVLATEPRGATVDEYLDRHGNTVHHFDLLEVHESLSVTVRSEVWTNAAYEAEEPTLSPLDRWDYLAPTRYVDLDDQVLEVAASPRPPDDPVEAAWELMGAVRGAMTYERGTTNVHTTAAEALSDGRGVCQDFAHVMIAACRLLGVPARYVSGYIYAPESASALASHAWVDVFADRQGWLSLDPTHDTAQGPQHVRVAVGRDYTDVPPTRGVFKGNGRESLAVAVRLEAL
jgi:transglutaminase-like putative cysteine protease